MPLACKEPKMLEGLPLWMLLKTMEEADGSSKMVVCPAPILKLFHPKTVLREVVVICKTFPCWVAWAEPESTVIPCGLASLLEVAKKNEKASPPRNAPARRWLINSLFIIE